MLSTNEVMHTCIYFVHIHTIPDTYNFTCVLLHVCIAVTPNVSTCKSWCSGLFLLLVYVHNTLLYLNISYMLQYRN